MTSNQVDMKFSDLNAVILAGGLGTRLNSIVHDRSKVMAEISGRPFLTYLLEQLEALGVRKAVICTGHKAEKLEHELGEEFGKIKLTYSRETTPLGTAGALSLSNSKIDSEWALVLNGDSYFTGDWTEVFKLLNQSNAVGALALAELENCADYGLVKTDSSNRISEFIEKSEVADSGWINAGVYVLKTSILNSIPNDRFVSLENEMFPLWINSGLLGCRIKGELLDIGTPERLASAETFLSTYVARAQGAIS